MKNVVFLLSFVLGTLSFSQTPELFYEDGGDLGPLEIRDGNIYYLERGMGLKELSLQTPENATLIVSTQSFGGVKNIFWGVEGSQVYFSNISSWYKSPFDPTQLNEASFYLSYTGNLLFDIKTTSDGYVLSLSDIGTFFVELSDVDPIDFTGQVGFAGGQCKFIAIGSETFYYSDNSDKMLYGAAIDDFYNTNEMLFEFEVSISQLETWGDQLYVVTKNDNTITVFNVNQDSPWTPIHTIALDEELYSLENIVINNGDIYFTDSSQGNIYIINEEALAVEIPLKEAVVLNSNPVGDYLSVNLQNSTRLKIFDTTGKLINTFYSVNFTNTFDVSVLPRGVYFAELTTQDYRNVVVKFVKD